LKREKIMELLTHRLILKDFDQQDYDFYKKLVQDPYTLMYESDQIPSEDEVLEQFKTILELKRSEKREKWSLIIKHIDNHQPIGRIVLWEVDSSISEWEIGWYIDKQFAGLGYATEAALKMLDFAFNHLNAHRVQALCHHLNRASVNVMLNIGMKQEGLLRAIRFLNHEWIDMLIFSILETDYEVIKNEY